MEMCALSNRLEGKGKMDEVDGKFWVEGIEGKLRESKAGNE
jgi:hypothetical protein